MLMFGLAMIGIGVLAMLLPSPGPFGHGADLANAATHCPKCKRALPGCYKVGR